MKKIVGLLLAIVMTVSMTFSTRYAADNLLESKIITVNEFNVYGVEYYRGMEVVENESQLEYTLNIESISFEGNVVSMKGNVLHKDKKMATIDDIGTIYKSTAKKLIKVNGVTAIFSHKEDMEIISCSFEEKADLGELLPVNENLNGKTVLKLAIKIDNMIIYFEGELPIGKKYNDIFEAAIDPSDERKIMTSKKDITEAISEKEVVQLSEHWKYDLVPYVEAVEIMEGTILGNQTRATSPVLSIPTSAFLTEGRWQNVGGTSVGYYMVTYSVAGTNNYVSYVLKWDYLKNTGGDMDDDGPSEGSTGFTILIAREYTYYAVRDSIECTDTFAPFKIKNAEVSMGLLSDREILVKVEKVAKANGNLLRVNWRSLLGLLPFGVYYTAAVTLFNAIEYSEAVNSPVNNFHETAAAQLDAYEKLVRGHELTGNGYDFSKEGDKLQINFSIFQPSDLERQVATHYIANKYSFDIYERNGALVYTNLVCEVNQNRLSSYRVLEEND